jgi:hypothetical protein
MEQYFRVNTIKLDSLPSPKIDLIKIDVEGLEASC